MENVEKLERAKKVLEFLRTATEEELENWADNFSVNIGDPNDEECGLDDAIIEERNEKGFKVIGIGFGDGFGYDEPIDCFVTWEGELTVLKGPAELTSNWKYLGDFAY